MSRSPGILLVAVAAVAASPAAQAGRRALLVGNDVGIENERPLRHTARDVRRLADTLVELGGFAPEDVSVLEAAQAGDVLYALDEIAAASEAQAAPLFFFFYSGHADASALHLGGTRLPLDLLLARFAALPAELRIVVVDSCQSGAATRQKGARLDAPFEVHADAELAKGQVIISSSAANEQSFESDSQQGAVFSLSWTTGLRGAADRDGDARVTLGEAYAYAYAQTLRATLIAPSGPQHARFRWDLAGNRDPVLSELRTGTHVILRATHAGDYVLFDGGEREVIAEMALAEGEEKQLSLSPGKYVVRKRGVDGVRAAQLLLRQGEDALLSDYQMQPVAFARLASKGAWGTRSLSASVGQLSSSLGPDGAFLVSAGPEWEDAYELLSLQALFSASRDASKGLTTRTRLGGVSGAVHWGLRLGPTSVWAGPVLGLLAVAQLPTGRDAQASPGLLFGARLRLAVSLTPELDVVTSGELAPMFVRLSGDVSGWGRNWRGVGMLSWATWAVGVRAAW